MHLLLIHQNFPGQFRSLIPAFLERGHQLVGIGARPLQSVPQGLRYLHYAPPDQDTDQPRRLVDPDLEQCLRRGSQVAALAVRLRDQGFVPDAVLFHSGWGEGLYLREIWPEAALIAYPELYGQPALLGHGFDPDLEPISEASRQALKRQNLMALAAIADADAAVVPTLFQRDTFPAHLRSRFQLIHEGVDLSRALPHPRRHVQLSAELTLRKGDPVVTFVNRSLEPLRGFRTLMRALPALQAAHPTVQVLIVGDTSGSSYSPPSRHPEGYRGEMLALLGARLDRERVHFLGRLPHDQLLSLFQISAAHVYLTVPYALSWSVLEAMACGAPVVGSANAPLLELLRDGENGRLVPFHDHDRLTAVLLELLADPEAGARLGAAGRRCVEQRYDLRRSVDSYEQLITSLRLLPA